jgi:hypothetical protein
MNGTLSIYVIDKNPKNLYLELVTHSDLPTKSFGGFMLLEANLN